MPGDCSTAGFIWSSFTFNFVLLEISYTNFTHCYSNCGFPLGPIFVTSENNLKAEFNHLICFNNTADTIHNIQGQVDWTSSCIFADIFSIYASFQITNSIFKQGESTAIAIFAKEATLVSLKFSANQFLNIFGNNLKLHCPIESTVVIEKSLFIQTQNTKVTAQEYGIATCIMNATMLRCKLCKYNFKMLKQVSKLVEAMS